MADKAIVYLIPSLLHEDGLSSIHPYTIEAVKKCQVFFVENERTARRYLKLLWREMIIDHYQWFVVKENEVPADAFIQKIKEAKTIGIISEAGCPGVADPGQQLVLIAQQMQVEVKPLVGPNSILLALMASGMNGQQFQFVGYLPIKDPERTKAIKELEAESEKKNCTQIFIETPFRNNQMIDFILKNCKPSAQLCIAVDITGNNEWIKTKTVAEWRQSKPDIHKRPTIFLLYHS